MLPFQSTDSTLWQFPHYTCGLIDNPVIFIWQEENIRYYLNRRYNFIEAKVVDATEENIIETQKTNEGYKKT